MEGMEEKLGAILNNPQMMQQIMSMASSLSQPDSAPQEAPAQTKPSMDFDPAMLQKVMGLAGQLGVDNNQKALLRALQPYLSVEKVQRLEKAMRAAKLAGLATTAFNSGALSFLTGR